MEEPRQLWVVTDNNDNWLWYGRGSQAEAMEMAKKATVYDPRDSLHLFAVAMEIIIEPEVVK